jgi:hypothetical protein
MTVAEDPAIPPLQAAAINALAEVCPTGAHDVLAAAARSADALVARAARLAERRCTR